MLFYLSVFAARHVQRGPTNCRKLCLDWENVLNQFHSTKCGLPIQTNRATSVLFEVLGARAGRGYQAEGDGLSNTEVLLPRHNHKLCQDARLSACRQFRGLLGGEFSMLSIRERALR